ncbi:MAG: S8 family serine peptidase [Bacteroidales bacterium]|nr:S8 family serine peptidase [Bacteroidales bacterium]
MSKRLVLMYLFFCVFGVALGQDVGFYFVHFKDKNNNPFSLNHPEQFLTQRAIDRRANYNLPVTETDIPVTPQYLQGIAATGVTLLNATKWLNGVTFETSDSNAVNNILQLNYVQSVRLIKLVSGTKKAYFENESVSKNGLKSGLKAGSYDYGYALTQISQINGTKLHDEDFRGQNMVIAVLDGGFLDVPQQIVFDSLHNEGRLLGTKDFVNPGGTVYTASDHGRMVLSCMAADDPGLMIGTAPKASYWLLRTEDIASESVLEEYNWVSGAEFADSVGADIINSSLGYTSFDDTSDSYSYSDLNGKTAVSTIGAEIACSKGILVVNSAGNSGSTSFPWVGAPADEDSVFTIGAVNASGNRAYFSSTGPTSDGRIKPTVMAMGYQTTVADGSSGVLSGNGTSFSSPIIAGMSACLWQAHPKATNMQVISAIKETASLNDNPNNLMGWGIPDYSKADSVLTVLTSVQKTKNQDYSWKIFPNPFDRKFEIRIENNNKSGSLTVKLFNLLGQNLVSKNFILKSGTTKYSVSDLTDLNPGYYIVAIDVNGTVINTRVLKVR